MTTPKTGTRTMELPACDEMLTRLSAAWGDPITGASLFPYYTLHECERLDGKGIVDMLVTANEQYATGKPAFILDAVTHLIRLFSAALIGDNPEVLADARARHDELGHM